MYFLKPCRSSPLLITLCLTYLSLASLNLIGAAARPLFVPNQLVVRFRPETIDSIRTQVFQRVRAIQIRQRIFAKEVYQLDFTEGSDLDGLIAALRSESSVVLASRNSYFNLSVIPNDTYFGNQWNMRNTGQSGGTPNVDISAVSAWDKTTGSSAVTVAVIDVGFEVTHEDLAASMLPGYNVADDNTDVSDNSPNGHGTAVAGILGAIGNNTTGVAGLGWNIKLLPIKFWNLGTGTGGTDADMVDAIRYAQQHGAKIVNCSFNNTFGLPQTILEMNADAAPGIDMLFVVSAGNAPTYSTPGTNLDTLATGDEAANSYPCREAVPTMICVAAVDRFGNRSAFSHYGLNEVHLGAPGQEIWSTKVGNTYGLQGPNGGGYPNGTGTSFAAPHVSGTLALMKSLNSTYDYKKLKEYLLLAAQPTPTGQLDDRTQTGAMVNANFALTAFGDSFDDATTDSRFFTNDTTGTRWGIPNGGLCDLFAKMVPQVPGVIGTTTDRTAELKFSGIAGAGGSTFSIASYKMAYPPGSQAQTVVLRVMTPDRSEFVGKQGRVGVGIVGETSQQTLTCSTIPQPPQQYTQVGIGGSMIAGIDLDTRKPFIYFDPPYFEYTYPDPPIILTNRKKLSISLTYAVGAATLRISDTATGEQLALWQNIQFPPGWAYVGTDKPAIVYYGTTSGTSGSLYGRAFLSVR